MQSLIASPFSVGRLTHELNLNKRYLYLALAEGVCLTCLLLVIFLFFCFYFCASLLALTQARFSLPVQILLPYSVDLS